MTRNKRPRNAPAQRASNPDSTPAITPLTLAQARTGAPPVTSMQMATLHTVEADRYSPTERAAARAVHAMDYGLNQNASDALTFVDATGWPGF